MTQQPYSEQLFDVRTAIKYPIDAPIRWNTLQGGRGVTLTEAVDSILGSDLPIFASRVLWLIPRNRDRYLTENDPTGKDWSGFIPLR